MEHCQCDWQGKGYKAMPITRRNPLPAPQQDAELQKLVWLLQCTEHIFQLIDTEDTSISQLRTKPFYVNANIENRICNNSFKKTHCKALIPQILSVFLAQKSSFSTKSTPCRDVQHYSILFIPGVWTLFAQPRDFDMKCKRKLLQIFERDRKPLERPGRCDRE